MTFAGFGWVDPQYASRILAPDDRARILGVDAERGAPQGAEDITRRPATYLSRVVGSEFQISDGVGAWTTVLDVPGASRGFTFSFDQNMRPLVAYQLGDDVTSPAQRTAYLYWYDNIVPGFTTLNIGACVSPFLHFDYSLDSSLPGAEVLLFYLRDGHVYHRRQADRFTVEYDDGPVPVGKTRITGVGLGSNYRLHVRLGR